MKIGLKIKHFSPARSFAMAKTPKRKFKRNAEICHL
jgi:hypothetical protein